MKKKVVLLILVLCVCLFSVIVYASTSSIQATKVQFPIVVDNGSMYSNIPMVSIDDRIYLPIRAMCEVLDIGINWNDEGRVEIMTDKENAETTNIEIGYYGIDGWTTSKTLDLELSKETAITIADDVFLQIKGEKFLMETSVRVNETDDGMCYIIYRCREPILPGGDISIIIRKSDGKILRIIAEE